MSERMGEESGSVMDWNLLWRHKNESVKHWIGPWNTKSDEIQVKSTVWLLWHTWCLPSCLEQIFEMLTNNLG